MSNLITFVSICALKEQHVLKSCSVLKYHYKMQSTVNGFDFDMSFWTFEGKCQVALDLYSQ